MRNIKYIAIHCTAGRQTQSIRDLQAEFKAKGWKSPGYHYVIEPNGKLTKLLDSSMVSNGVQGYNSVTINIAYIGGIDKNLNPIDNRTKEQKETIVNLLQFLRKEYPNAVIQGHRDFPNVAKECPCFDAKDEYKDI